MAGTFPGFVGVQQFDQNGRPMQGALLSIFDAVTNTLVDTFQDYALTVPAKNPIAADRSGRLPVVYVADGMYRLRLSNAVGNTSNGGFDYASVPSIGQQLPVETAQIDPTGVSRTGDFLIRLDVTQIAGYVRLNGLTIGNTYSGATERSNADCEALFKYAWGKFDNSQLPVIGGRGVSANADWSANKQLTLFSGRGLAMVGADGMGNSRANVISNASTSFPDTPGATGGAEQILLSEAQMPPHNHGGSTGVENQGHTHSYTRGQTTTGATYVVGGSTYPLMNNTDVQSSGPESQTHIHPIAPDGGGQPHLNMPPFMVAAYFWKL